MILPIAACYLLPAADLFRNRSFDKLDRVPTRGLAPSERILHAGS